MSDLNVNDILSGNIRKIAEDKTKETLLLPLLPFRDIKYIPPDFLVEDILVASTVGFVSASPGSHKTWFVWDIALSVATGTKALGVHKTRKGTVLAFNAEDSPGAITKPRLTALASERGININDVNDLAIIDVPILNIGDDTTQARIKATLDYYKPSLLILDPLRQIHYANEDKASEMAPILSFLRELQRVYGATVLLVVHERKGSLNNDNERREDRTRGSNVLEGWRDTAIYLDAAKGEKTKASCYHRGHLAPEPFFFSLNVEAVDGEMSSAKLEYFTLEAVQNIKIKQLSDMVWEAVGHGADTTNKVVESIGRRKSDVSMVVNIMLSKEFLVRKNRKLVQEKTPDWVGFEAKNDVF